MGKKQRMRKAAAAIAAKAAAANAAASDAAVKENQKENVSDVRDNMQKMMKLAENLQSCSFKSNSKCHPSSGSGSSASDTSDSDDAPTLMQSEVAGKDQKSISEELTGANFIPIPKYSRNEKKARRLLMKLDLEPILNVSRVTMRKAKNVLLCIDQPEVYKCANSKTLICFGEVRIEDSMNTAAAQAAERYLNDGNVPKLSKQNDEDTLANDEEEDDDDSVEIDAGGLDEKDIELVQMQAACSRQKAIKALLKHNSDVVNAIMDLTVC